MKLTKKIKNKKIILRPERKPENFEAHEWVQMLEKRMAKIEDALQIKITA